MNISYVYRITHKQTSKWYIGSRTTSVDPLDDLGIRYFTSGVAQVEFKSNPDTFTCEILFTHESREVVNAEESRLIDETDAVGDPMSYNIANWPLVCNPVKAGKKAGYLTAELGIGIHAQTYEDKVVLGKKSHATMSRLGIGSYSEEFKRAMTGEGNPMYGKKIPNMSKANKIRHQETLKIRAAVEKISIKAKAKLPPKPHFLCSVDKWSRYLAEVKLLVSGAQHG